MQRHISPVDGARRLAYGLAAGLCVTLVAAMLGVRGMALGLVSWCGGVLVYLGLAFWLARRYSAQQVRRRAQSLDSPGLLLMVSLLVAILISVVSIAMLLGQVKEMQGPARVAHVALALVALAGSWLMIHTLYAFHYAHSYYRHESDASGGGLVFPGKAQPNYVDFLYYSFVIGMTSQVSDVQVSSREMRGATLIHGVLAFAFNLLVLALSVNVVAGAI